MERAAYRGQQLPLPLPTISSSHSWSSVGSTSSSASGWISAGFHCSNASGCHSSHSWSSVGSPSSNASSCYSSCSWICGGSHSSNASGCNRPPSSNANGCNSPYSSVATQVQRLSFCRRFPPHGRNCEKDAVEYTTAASSNEFPGRPASAAVTSQATTSPTTRASVAARAGPSGDGARHQRGMGAAPGPASPLRSSAVGERLVFTRRDGTA